MDGAGGVLIGLGHDLQALHEMKELDGLCEPGVFFTTHHFDGFPAVLCRLEELDAGTLSELVGEAWACRAPRRLLAQHPLPD